MKTTELERQLDQWLAQNSQQMVDDIVSLVNIKSVSSAPAGRYPYGEGCAKALDCALALSRQYGLEAENHQYHCGTALLAGASSQEIGMFTHVDIVPEGENWIFEPYKALVRQGCIIGRGASDNKGPAMAALHALRCLQDLGVQLNHSVRIYFGCNEENGMSDLSYYLQRHRAPQFSLIPDCTFPVCNGEKGIMKLQLAAQIRETNLLSISGGTVTNMVPSFAYALLSGVDYNEVSALAADSKAKGISVFYEGDHVGVTAEGIAGHAAFPSGTVNAIQELAVFLSENHLVTGDAAKPLAFIANAFADACGQGLGIGYEDELSGPLTHVGSVIAMTNGQLTQDVNIRYPITADTNRIVSEISARCGQGGMEILRLENDPPSYLPVDHPAVRMLRDLSNQILKRDEQPYVMGGGTYARKLPNAVGYGAGVKGPSPFGKDRGDGHQPDECVRIQDMVNAVKIYCMALIKLDQML